jgi:NAD-dependent deacetylase
MATLSHYMNDPEVRKRSWQMKLEHTASERKPNSGHAALVALERRGKLHTLITQNVDGLHHDAGHDPEKVIEIHGTLREVVCMACDERAPIERALIRVRAGESDPPCRSCGGILKSATISFGQGLVAEDLSRSEAAARECDLMFAIGTTLGVYPAAAVVPVARECGARVVILNAEATEMDALAHVMLRGSISAVLPQIV